MNLQEMGARLRQERERRGLTLDEVVLKTKISRSNLLAIESGRKDDLPHPVYAKGFVKNYARLLGLDPEEFGRALALEYAVAENDFGLSPAVDKPVPVQDRRTKARARQTRWKVMVLILAVVLAVVGITISLVRTPQERPVEIALPSEESGSATGSAAGPAAGPAPEAAAPAPLESVVQEAAPEQAALPETGEALAPVREAPAPAPLALDRQAPALPSAALYAHHLDILANNRCWVLASVDNESDMDFTLFEGERKRLRFNHSLSIKFGNAGGVSLTLDNRPVENPAQSGQVRTFTFP